MKAAKKRALEAAGWRIGDAKDFLELSPQEAAYLEVWISLRESVRARRRDRSMTQAQLAKAIHSTQSRVAKMENGDPSVSLDFLVRAFLALGGSSRDLSRAISQPSRAKGSAGRAARS